MLKPLLFILTLVILLALGLNLGLFDAEIDATVIPKKKPIVNTVIQNEHSPIIKQEENRTKVSNVLLNNDNNLSKKFVQLLKDANLHFQKSEDSEALKIYNEIIEESKKSNNPKILKYFSDAIFAKAMLHNIYPNNDSDAAIETYDELLELFSTRKETELLKLYMAAKLEQAKLMSKEDLLSAYDELINKFGKDKEHRFDKEVEEFLFAKSFELMGDNDEEAMEVLDDIIAKYQRNGNKKLPETVQYSILNNIELSIITNNDDEKYVDLANKYLSKEKGTTALLDMLNIIKNAQDLNQEDAIKEWSEKHADYYFPNWDFSELEQWANKMENPEGKQRIREYLTLFKKQKYSRPYQPSGTVYTNSKESTSNSNSTHTVYYGDNEVASSDYENLNEENYPTYEPDPYINDIYQDNNYPDPYQDQEPIQYENPYINKDSDLY